MSTRKCPYYSEKTRKAWCKLEKQVEKLEKTHHKAWKDEPIEGGSGPTPNQMMERTTCMQKEITKWLCNCKLPYLANNAHINEEINLLKKDMEILGEDLTFKLFKRRTKK